MSIGGSSLRASSGLGGRLVSLSMRRGLLVLGGEAGSATSVTPGLSPG
jgi:hypothetical protein